VVLVVKILATSVYPAVWASPGVVAVDVWTILS
jgi:hypothetical protein